MAPILSAALHYIVNHVVLPPQLPSSVEPVEEVRQGEKNLLRLTLQAVQELSRCGSRQWEPGLAVLEKALCNWATINAAGHLSIEQLMSWLSNVEINDVIPLLIHEQNAALFIRMQKDGAIFESFEVSPQTGPVMKCKGSLRRSFPAGAVFVPKSVFDNNAFRKELVHTLRKLDMEVVDEIAPTTKKAGHNSKEIRDTVHPRLVTEMLMAILTSLGHSAAVPQIHKRIRDDVIWHSSLIPWRRSSLWLAVRVTLQTSLSRVLPCGEALAAYKNLMIVLLVKILHVSMSSELPLDLCFVIQAKIARRIFKLGTAVLGSVHDDTLAVGRRFTNKVEHNWRAVQENDAVVPIHIDLSIVEEDTVMTLNSSRQYLDSVLNDDVNISMTTKTSDLAPSCPELLTYDQDHLPRLPRNLHGHNLLFALAKLEIWAARYLPTWTTNAKNTPNDDQCTRLTSLATDYKQQALAAYAGSPEQLSMMLLTIAHMWLALDTIAGELIPLLHQFSPELYHELFQPLLLPKKEDMVRLKMLEDYVTSRQNKSNPHHPPIFSIPSDSGIAYFSGLYYGLANELQELRQQIQIDATRKWHAKKIEWETTQRQFDDLTAKAAALSCTTVVDDWGNENHDPKCNKCKMEKEAKGLRIGIYEWPLPENEAQCRAAVFELACPKSFIAWRDLTWMLLQDIGRKIPVSGDAVEDTVSSYYGLKAYHSHNTSRITLASSVKSSAKSHYNKLGFPTTTSQIYRNNGLQYSHYDSGSNMWVIDQGSRPSLASYCQSKLPEGPYRGLQLAVDSTVHSQSAIIADQISCSKDLTLHELIAFGSLRADGEETQWHNIRRELGASNLSINTEAVCTLITQAALQAGCSANTELRLAHSVVGESQFCTGLLVTINSLLISIETNWKSEHTIKLIIILTSRILSITPDRNCRASAVNTIRKCRLVLSDWIEGLERVLEITTEGDRVRKVQQTLLTFGLLGKKTYDLDDDHGHRIMDSLEDVQHWARFSIVTHDNTPGSSEDLCSSLHRMLANDKKISVAQEALLYALISHGDNPGLDQAIKQIWSDFRPSQTPWTRLEAPNGCWLQKNTLPFEGRDTQMVSYNMLDGQLLVGGRPLGRLPQEYNHSHLYVRIFGSQIFPVFSSYMPGMLYMTAREVEGYQLHFGKRGSDIIIRMRKGNTTLEAIPHEKLRGDLPSKLVDGYLHWLDLSTHTMEFRALSKPYEPSTEWKLNYQAGKRSFLTRGDRKLVDVRSTTASSITSIFAPLEIPAQIHIVTSRARVVEVDLPRLALQFFLNKQGHLECKELRKIIDPNQFIGTLIGLRSKMVLCEHGVQAQALDRTVIIPKGEVTIKKRGKHVDVTISNENEIVGYLRFQVDPILGRLRGDSSLLSRLHQSYLHALTSGMLPDPLTRRTGTEEALSILDSQMRQIREPLHEQAVAMLKLLSALTPHRSFYPAHLEVMQRVRWSSGLSFLAQHDSFAPLCAQLLSSGARFQIFYPDDEETSSLDQRGSLHLLQRASMRHSAFRSLQYGGDTNRLSDDSIYPARDHSSITARGERSYQIATLVARWPSNLQVSQDLASDFQRWGTVSGFGKQFATSTPIVNMLGLSFSESWAPLYGFCCRSNAQTDKYKLLFTFATIAYGSKVGSLDDLMTLLAFAFLDALQEIQIPSQHESYTLSIGSSPHKALLTSTLKQRANAFVPSIAPISAPQLRQERTNHHNQVESQAAIVAQSYIAQWPSDGPTIPSAAAAPLLKLQDAHPAIVSKFKDWIKNRDMEAYLNRVQEILNGVHEICDASLTPKNWQGMTVSTRSYNPCVWPSLPSLLTDPAPKVKHPPDPIVFSRPTNSPVQNARLQDVLSDLVPMSRVSHADTINHKYKRDLEDSFDAFRVYKEVVHLADLPFDNATIKIHYVKCENYLDETYDIIRRALAPDTTSSILLPRVGCWPRLTLADLLGLLASVKGLSTNQQWFDCLLRLGKAVLAKQRARRLVLAAESGNIARFFFEAENLGCMGWDPCLHPDWILIETENDFLIRPMQARVAQEMLAPASASNTLTQLNMGEGKSSVIVPIVAAALADGEQLSRVLVLKSLTRQMLDTLAQRLGGLVGRQVYYMPFSRKTPVDQTILSQIQALYEECLKTRGVLLVQPEFLLSFKLMGIERLTSGDDLLSPKLLGTQKWLEENARDLLDESDEILDVKFQLIYTIGNQRNMDGQPDRWLLTQSLFDLVDKHATAMASSCPEAIEVERRSDASFPVVRLLSSDAGARLISEVLEDVVGSKLPGLNLERWALADTGILRHFLQDIEIADQHCSDIAGLCRGDVSLTKKLLLLRGLIAHKVLLFILRGKRWSVNFGQHPSRCLVAVPYRAKGVPAATAEFGHPDVTIALTCLTYYYAGLSNHQTRLCFELLQKSDDPSLEYQNWTQRCSTLPPALRDWNAVNLEDEQQCYYTLFPALRYCKKVADFYLANVVFPREGKEFDQKLSTSGWDIPLKPKPGSRQFTTGFSGTNDNRFLLPSSISQQDLPELRHTSGKVLDYVLRPENLRYECAKDKNGRQLSAEGLLDFITQIDRQARVLIDVGAQVLETTNEDLVKYWIRQDADIDVDAGIFFDADDKVMVVARGTGKIEPFATSSFSGRMDRCLVYLDEVHTRGTDLPLPKDARAVVTLGPRLTKDRLVQACMRLRQLAHGQSLLFVAPPEVHRDIVKITGHVRLDGYSVVRWALAQSLAHIKRAEPLRIMQGLSYHRRQKAAEQYFASDPEEGEIIEDSATSMFVENEEQSLHDLYAPLSMKAYNGRSLVDISAKDMDPEVQALIRRWNEIDPNTTDGANVQEEHEREVAHEVEQETEIQRPPAAKALKESVDENLPAFVKTGSLAALQHFQLADSAIVRKSSAAKLLGKKKIWRALHVSKGFSSTVEHPASGYYDDYFRPVNWVLTSKREEPASTLLIISQYEVNQLLNAINAPSSAVILHSYEPRVTRAMSSVDSMTTTPLSQATQNWLKLHPSLRRQLHLFAGQLYINTYEEYKALRKESASVMVALPFLKEWIGIRRRGQNYLQTHIGRMVNGWNLQEGDFQ